MRRMFSVSPLTCRVFWCWFTEEAGGKHRSCYWKQSRVAMLLPLLSLRFRMAWTVQEERDMLQTGGKGGGEGRRDLEEEWCWCCSPQQVRLYAHALVSFSLFTSALCWIFTGISLGALNEMKYCALQCIRTHLNLWVCMYCKFKLYQKFYICIFAVTQILNQADVKFIAQVGETVLRSAISPALNKSGFIKRWQK